MSMPTTATWSAMAPHQHQAAYNAVPTRTTLTGLAPSEAPATMEAKKIEWSPEIKNYVFRAFEPALEVPGISKKDIMDKIREILTFYGERGVQDSINWEAFPLPQRFMTEKLDLAQINIMNLTNKENETVPIGYTNHYTPLSSSSKRKSMELDSSQSSPMKATPPWQKTNALVDRISYTNGHKDKRAKKNGTAGNNQSKFDPTDLEKRRQRFQLDGDGTKTTPTRNSPRNDSESEMAFDIIIGTNESLEKSYLRLTAPPKAETVRPQRVLEKTLDMLRRKWKKEEKNYNYICNQFKSLRQDLTVQHIKNAFTVRVYETHARIALERGDLGEYNQCQTQLRMLYALKLGGHPAEFLAYRILYFVYTCNKADMNDLLAELTPTDQAENAVKHALDVRSSLALGNYHKFFKLYLDPPNMGVYLMDMFVERERLHALANISRAYMSVTLRFLADELAFENDDECREFLETTCNAQHLIEEKHDDKTGREIRVIMRGSAAHFDKLRAAAFSKIDIKGQI